MSFWTVCTAALEHELPEQQFNTWVRPLQVVESDGILRLLAPNRFVVDWISSNLSARIAAILAEIAGCEVPFSVEVGARPPSVAPAPAVMAPEPSARSRRPEPLMLGVRLNPESTFEAFVEGKSNHFAKAAAIQVAEPDHLPASSSATLEADHAARGCERLTRWRLAAFGWSAREPLRVVGVARRQQQGIGRKFTQIAVHDEHLRATKRSVRLDCKRGEECVCLVRRHARGRG